MTNMNQESAYNKVGDVVVGSSDPSKAVYSDRGTKLTRDAAVVVGDPSRLQSLANNLTKSALSNGGIPIDIGSSGEGKGTTKKKVRKKVVQSYPTETYQDPVSFMAEAYQAPITKEQVSIQFENDFGRMKAKIEDFVDHELAYMLVFSDEDAMVFEPKVGEKLILHTPSRQRVDVYYPGVTFDSPDSSKKFMILFKLPDEEEQ